MASIASQISYGTGGEILKTIADAVRQRGGTIAHVRRLLSEPEFADQIAGLLVQSKVDPEVYSLRVKGVAQLVEEGGYIIDSELDVSRYRDPTRAGLFYGVLLQPVGIEQIKQFLDELDRLSLRPATLQELLAFGISNAIDIDKRGTSVFTMNIVRRMEDKIPGVSYSTPEGLRVFASQARDALKEESHFLALPKDN